MRPGLTCGLLAGVSVGALIVGAQHPLAARQAGGGAPAIGMNILIPAIAPAVFVAADVNGDGSLTRPELKDALQHWYADAGGQSGGSIREAQLAGVLNTAVVQQLIQPAGRQDRKSVV